MDITVEDLPQEPKAGVVAQDNNPVEHLTIASRFNIDSPTKQEEKMMMELWEYGKSMSKVGDRGDILWQIIHLESTLGAPQLGQSRLEKLYKYAKLKRQERQIQEELKSVGTSANLY